MTLPLKILAVVVGLSAFLYAVVSISEFMQGEAFVSAHPLMSDLPRNIKEASREFQKRVREKFPSGSRETDLRAYLSSQSFHIAASDLRIVLAPNIVLKPAKDSAGTFVAEFRRPIFLGFQSWAVSWRHDTDDIVHDLHASYSIEMP